MTTGTKSEKENPNRVSEPPSETYLLAAAKGGCSTSFDLLCAPHGTRLLKTALKVTRNREDTPSRRWRTTRRDALRRLDQVFRTSGTYRLIGEVKLRVNPGSVSPSETAGTNKTDLNRKGRTGTHAAIVLQSHETRRQTLICTYT